MEATRTETTTPTCNGRKGHPAATCRPCAVQAERELLVGS